MKTNYFFITILLLLFYATTKVMAQTPDPVTIPIPTKQAGADNIWTFVMPNYDVSPNGIEALPYAKMSTESGVQTLTFAYGEKPAGAFELNTSNTAPLWSSSATIIQKVVFDDSFKEARPTSCFEWFKNMKNLTEIVGIKENLNTSEVTNMQSMFYDCVSLKTIDVSNFNTEKVTTMNCMFRINKSDGGCTSLDIRNFKTAGVTDMEGMFAENHNLTTILVGDDWSVQGVVNNINISGKTQYSRNMFVNCYNLIGNDGTQYQNGAENVNHTKAHAGEGGLFSTDNYKIFYQWADKPNEYQAYTPSTFSGSTNVVISEPEREGHKFLYWTQVSTSGAQIGSSSSSLTIAAGDVGNRIYQMHWAVIKPYACLSADSKTLTFTRGVKPDGANYFDLNTEENDPGWVTYNENITKVVFEESFKDARPTSCWLWFSGMEKLTEIVGMKEYFNTSEVMHMGYMFADCKKLTTLDLSGFDTENVRNMMFMFHGCEELTTILIRGTWSTEKVEESTSPLFDCQLIGNDGTTSTLTKYDITYAHAGEGGLFTTGDYKIFYQWAGEETPVYHAHTPSTFVESSTSITIDNPETRADGAKFLYWTRVSAYGAQIGGSSSSLTIAAGDVGNRIYQMHWAVPYAVLEDDGTTLTFKYGEKPDGAFDLNEGSHDPAWDGYKGNITKVVFEESFKNVHPTTCYNWFGACSNLIEIVGMKEYLSTSEVKNMELMFYDCRKLTVLDLEGFDTKHVTNMKNMFLSNPNLTTILIGNNWVVKDVTSSDDMLSGCGALIGNDGSMAWEVFRWDSDIPTDKTCAHAGEGGLLTKDKYKIFYDLDPDDYDTKFKTYKNSVNEFLGSEVTLVEPEKEGAFFGYWTMYDLVKAEETASSATVTISASEVGNRIYQVHWILPYVVLSEDKKTLTFYFDKERESKTGTTYDLASREWLGPDNSEYITKVIFDASFKDARPTTCERWFDYLENLSEIVGMKEYLNTSKVTSMNGMFYNCKKLTTLDLRGFDTENVTDMESMFGDCENLTTIFISETWTTQNVTKSDNMFSVFYGGELIGNDGTYSVDEWNKTYAHANKGGLLTKDTYKIFYDLDSDDNPEPEFKTFKNSVNEYLDSEVTLVEPEKEGALFGYWTQIKLSPYEETASSATVTIGASEVGNRIYKAHWILPYAVLSEDKKTLTFYLDKERESKAGTTYDLKNDDDYDVRPAWLASDDMLYKNITKVVFDESFKNARPTACYGWFAGMENLTEIVGMKENLNTSKVTSMAFMFNSCTNLTTLDLSGFNTKNVLYMDAMFGNCKNLTTILTGANWSTEKVTEENTMNMFDQCYALIGNDGTLCNNENYVWNKKYAHTITGGLLTTGKY